MAVNAWRYRQRDEADDKQRRRAEETRNVLASWLADESGYDERVWPELKRSLEEDRTSSRPLFHE